MRLFFTLLCLAFSLSCFSQSAITSASVNAGCSPLLVTFDGTASTGQGPLNYEWDFGNGNTSSGTNQQAPGAIYSLPGTYQASLRVVDANGNISPSVFVSIVVYPNPDADFIASNNTGCPPLAVQFTDQSASGTGTIIEWIWDFGDGNSSTLENPSHTYTSGNYPVSLIVKDANGCTDIQVYPGLVDVEAELNVGMNTNGPRLTCDPTLTTQFIPDVQTTGTGPFAYLWDFGDGTTSTAAQPNKTYTAHGLYSVSLTVTDQNTGCSNTFTEVDYIRLIDTDLDIGVTPGMGCNPAVQLSNLSTILQADFIATWFFGDGDSLRGLAMAPSILNPVHTYAQSGSYSISLKLDMGNEVCIETFTLPNPVLVEGAPALDFVADNQTSCTAPLTVNFTSTAPRAVTWLWDFGDGYTSPQAIPQHTYAALERYDVSLTITDANGCTNTLNIINWNFTNLGSGGPDSLRIALTQSEEVRIEVRDLNDCPAEDSLFVEVIPYPEIDFSYDPLCLGDTLLLDATPPNIQDPTATFFWWKDQEPLGNLGPIISVTEEGSYELAYYLRGCLSEFWAEVFFNPLPESNIYEEQLSCIHKGQYVALDAGEAFDYNWLHTGESSRFVEVVAVDTYYVEVFNEFRCSVLDSTAVIDACPPLLYVPTAFSPNGDGINEEFAWGGDYLADFQMQIYSRWGMLLYETRDPAAFWDGRFKGQQVQEGVYTWIVRYNGTHPDYQKIFQRAGTVTVFR